MWCVGNGVEADLVARVVRFPCNLCAGKLFYDRIPSGEVQLSTLEIHAASCGVSSSGRTSPMGRSMERPLLMPAGSNADPPIARFYSIPLGTGVTEVVKDAAKGFGYQQYKALAVNMKRTPLITVRPFTINSRHRPRKKTCCQICIR